MKTLVLANQKGGVGKSAVATLLVHYFAQHGQRVLAIDLDHQGNFSKPLRMSERAALAAFTADGLMTGSVGSLPPKPFVLIPSERALLGLERQPAMHPPFARAFRTFLGSVDKQFDVCVIDTNPNSDIPLIAALASSDFDEDPDQPRRQFDAEALQQVADTITQRGVRQPISVRPHPSEPGRWMLNFGARRLRASKLAGKTEVPAFVDPMADTYDQVIENEQRESLKSLELALFFQRQMRNGDSQAEIARRLGETRGYVTFLCALIDAPDWLLDLYRSSRCRRITALYELRNLHAASPKSVEGWLADQDHVGRTEVQALKDELKRIDSTPRQCAPASPTPTPEAASDSGRATAAPAGESVALAGATRATAAASDAASKSIRSLPGSMTLWARYDGAEVTIELGAVPEEAGYVFVQKSHGTDRAAVLASSVQLLRITKA